MQVSHYLLLDICSTLFLLFNFLLIQVLLVLAIPNSLKANLIKKQKGTPMNNFAN